MVNLIALAVLVGLPALYLSLCHGTVTCTGRIPGSLLVAFGVVPALCYVISAAISVACWGRSISSRVVLLGALLSAVAAYVACAVVVLGFEVLVRPVLGDAVPVLLVASIVVCVWVPLTAVWNMVILLRTLTRSLSRPSSHAT